MREPSQLDPARMSDAEISKVCEEVFPHSPMSIATMILLRAVAKEAASDRQDRIVARLRRESKKRKAAWNAKPQSDEMLGEWSALKEMADVLAQELRR